jgi:hypothetical protein
MSLRPPEKSRTIRAVRRRAAPPPAPARTAEEPQPEPELSNYELIERRSHELEIERAHGGCGTSQPPDADTPLLFPRHSDPTAAPTAAITAPAPGPHDTPTSDRGRSRN